MNKMFLSILILISFSLSSKNIKTLDMTLVHEFEAKEGFHSEDEYVGTFFAIGSAMEPTGPRIYHNGGDFLLVDQVKARTILLDNNFDFKEVYNFNLPDAATYYYDNVYLNFRSLSGIGVIKDNEVMGVISFYDFKQLNKSKSAYYHEDTLFIHDKDNNLWSITDPGNDIAENRSKLKGEEETLKLFDNNGYYGLTIDEDKQLFLDGELKSMDYGAFYFHFKKKYSPSSLYSNYKFEIKATAASNMKYLGQDADGNTYWIQADFSIVIFNSEGFLHHIFDFDSSMSDSIPTVTPEGDLYFVDHFPNVVKLYKITRQW